MSGETLNLDRLQQLEHAVQSELEDTVKFINETRQFLSQDDQKSAYAVIDELAKSFVSVRQTRVDTERSLRDTDSHFLSDQEPQQTVDEFFDNAMKKYKEARTSDIDEHYTAIKNLIPDLTFETEEPVIPKKIRKLNDSKSRNAGQIEDVENEEFTVPIDPITRRAIAVPVRNEKCRHVYDNDSIRNYISTQSGSIRCPIPGCRNKETFGVDSLKLDQILYDKIIACTTSSESQET